MGTPDRPKLITGPEFARALEAAGIITGPLDGIARIVIVAEPESLVQVHVQHIGDERALDVGAILAGKAV